MQRVFKRQEIKYKITLNQKEEILSVMALFMKADKYGKSVIRNIYFDTDNFRLIRRSIEKPTYKEKLRLRSYKQVLPDKKIFVELKKKYNSTVYKRRILLSEEEVMTSIERKTPLPLNCQIADEINYFVSYYENLKPKVFLSYEREAFVSLDNFDLRITFDDNIRYRQTDLSLTKPLYGKRILEEGYVLMEIKTSGAIPLWLTQKLTEMKIFKTSFSKYGTAYIDMLKEEKAGEKEYARAI